MSWGPLSLRTASHGVVFDGEASPAPGGGSMPIQWRGPFAVDIAAWDANLLGTGNDGIPLTYAPPIGTQVLRYLIVPKVRFLVGGFVVGPEIDFYDTADTADPPTYFGSGQLRRLSPDPADWDGQWDTQIGDASPPIGGDTTNYSLMIEPVGPAYEGVAVLALGAGMGVALGPFGGQPTQGEADVWLESYEPPA